MMTLDVVDIKHLLLYNVFIIVVKGYIHLHVSLDASKCFGSSLNMSCVVDNQTTTIQISKSDGLYVGYCLAPLGEMDTVCTSYGSYKIAVFKSGTLTTIVLTIPSLNKSEHNGIWRCEHGNENSSVEISVISLFTTLVKFPVITTSPVNGGTVSNVTINGHVYCQNTELTPELLYAHQEGQYKVLNPQPIWSDVDVDNNFCDSEENDKIYTSSVTRTMSALRGKRVTLKIRLYQPACNSSFTTKSSPVFFFPDPPDDKKTLINGIGAGSSLSLTEGENRTLQCEVNGGVPLAVIKWNCFGGTVTNTSAEGNARSNITFTTTDSQNGKFCTCSATHPVAIIAETSVLIHVAYSPKNVVLSPENLSFTFNQSQNLGPIECSADCNPNCTYKWNVPKHLPNNEHKLYIKNITKDQDGLYNCIATNILGTMSSKNVTVDVNYGPEFVIVEPPNTAYTINENQTLGEIYCSADCKPNCSYVWNGPGIISSKQTLRIDNIHRNQSGVYNCTARNILGLRYSHIITVKVKYAAKITSMVITGNNFTVNENSEPQITCNADGFPAPIITLRHVRTETILASNTGDNLYFKFPFTKCEDTGQYRCEATNYLNTLSSITKELYVLCEPRRIDKTESKIAFVPGGTLNISTMYLAYPKPDFIWYLENKEFYNKTQLENSEKKLQINNTFEIENIAFRHGSLIIRNHLEKPDFGTYTIIATNEVDSSIDSFIVSAKGKPNKPSFVQVNCTDKRSATISWISEFDNGYKQSFYIQYKTGGEIKNSTNIADIGHRYKITKEIVSLKESSIYQFKVVAKNKLGDSHSSEVNCTSSAEKSYNILPAALAGGFGSAAFSIIVIILVIYVLRRFKCMPCKGARNTELNGKSASTSRQYDENDEDDMRINELYVSAGPNYVKPGSSSGAVGGTNDCTYSEIKKTKGQNYSPGNQEATYAIVQKKTNKNSDPSSTFAVVDKTKRNENGRAKRKQKTVKPTPQVCENFEDMEMTNVSGESLKSLKTSQKRNEDGLIYLDLDLPEPQNNNSGIFIHGEENRVNYVEVDFTKRAVQELPDDEKKNEI